MKPSKRFDELMLLDKHQLALKIINLEFKEEKENE